MPKICTHRLKTNLEGTEGKVLGGDEFLHHPNALSLARVCQGQDCHLPYAQLGSQLYSNAVEEQPHIVVEESKSVGNGDDMKLAST